MSPRSGKARSLAVAAVVALSFAAFASDAAAATPSVAGQIIVRFAPTADRQAINRALGGQAVSSNAALGTQVVAVPAGKEDAFVDRYRARSGVVYAERDAKVEAFTADPHWAKQWGLDNSATTLHRDSSFVLDADVDAPEAWALATPPTATVAVLDTGIDQNHADLAGRIVAQRNFTTSKTLDDKYGHGTHVAGIVAAIPNNSVGVAGGAPNARLLNGKVLGDTGSGSCSSVSNGITWAADQGAKVISLSLGGGACSAENTAVQYASNKGSLVVAAAGNSGTSSTSSAYPAAYKPALAVAATDNSDLVASFSNFGSWVEIAAPGVDIFSTLTNHTSQLSKSASYGYLSGTSMATPLVSAAAAFVVVADTSGNGKTNDELRTRLISTADRPSTVTSKIAGGRLNVCRAVSGAASC